MTEKIAWDLDELWFISVDAVVLAMVPFLSNLKTIIGSGSCKKKKKVDLEKNEHDLFIILILIYLL